MEVTNFYNYGTMNEVEAGATQINNYFGNKTQEAFSDEQVAQALTACVGKDRVISNKKCWAGAYWCLRWMCNYPVDVSRFCEKIQSLPVSFPGGYECSYESIRKLCTLSFMDYDPRKMEEVKVSRTNQAEFALCREVALKLGEELVKASLPNR